MSMQLFSRKEWGICALLLAFFFGYGIVLETRTALKERPRTDLGVFCCASWALWHGENPYAITDWNGWHYHYPPLFAILMGPLGHKPPTPPKALPEGVSRTRENTPWGYQLGTKNQYIPLGLENSRFFALVALWYLLSVALTLFSIHTLASSLEGSSLLKRPPSEDKERQAWWCRRLIPLLLCAPPLFTVFSRGQVEVLMLAALSFGIYLFSRQRQIAAGLFLIMPVCIKLLPVFLLWPLWWRSWRLLLGMLAGILIGFVVIPVITLGPERTTTVYEQWTEQFLLPSLGAKVDPGRNQELLHMNATDNQSVLTFIHNWTYRHLTIEERPKVPFDGAKTLALSMAVVLAGVLLFFGRDLSQNSSRDVVLGGGLLACLALLFNPVIHSYSFVLVLPLLTALVDVSMDSAFSQSYRRTIIWVLSAFILTAILSTFTPLKLILRDLGLPLISLLALFFMGLSVYARRRLSLIS